MVPVIQELGCCSRLGTWSAAYCRAGFLQLPSRTCPDGARRYLLATSAGDTAWGTVPWLALVLGTPCATAVLPTLPQGELWH